MLAMVSAWLEIFVVSIRCQNIVNGTYGCHKTEEDTDPHRLHPDCIDTYQKNNYIFDAQNGVGGKEKKDIRSAVTAPTSVKSEKEYYE